MARQADKSQSEYLLKGGTIVDGSGSAPFVGNLLIRGGAVHRISPRPVRTAGVVIDCTGKIVAPGFFDGLSSMDWKLAVKGREAEKWPFLAQGITTFIAGASGASAAGFREGTTFRAHLESRSGQAAPLRVEWETVEDYFALLSSMGTSHNLALLAGHGTVRASIRGGNPSPLHPYETGEMLRLLERAMDQGARGVSLGLLHEPGTFASREELRDVALAVKKRGKVLAVHPRTLAAVSPAYPVKTLGRPHNLQALDEVLELARSTGVRTQVSPLLFVGARTWRTADDAIIRIERAVEQGADVGFDAPPFPVSAAAVRTLLPPWFLARLPGAWEDGTALRRLRRELGSIQRLLGFGGADIQLTDAVDQDLKRYDGMFISEICRQRRMKSEDLLAEIAQGSGGRACLLFHRCSSPSIMEALMRHPACLVMTNAMVEPAGVQNPGAFGAFPRFLQLVREKKLMRMEEAVHKLTGSPARRYGIADRGVLTEGSAADITVLDWDGVRDNTSPEEPDAAPSGIDYVFLNGRKILSGGKKESPLNAGVPLPG
jgi:N-acyl-D-amino-acid deacylase